MCGNVCGVMNKSRSSNGSDSSQQVFRMCACCGRCRCDGRIWDIGKRFLLVPIGISLLMACFWLKLFSLNCNEGSRIMSRGINLRPQVHEVFQGSLRVSMAATKLHE